MSILFVAGPGRSGTTAFANYLNQHPEILICRERYKFIHSKITPDHFTFGRILDYREGESNLPRDYHVDLLAKKDSEKLRWIGDKTPDYVKSLKTLSENNPGSRFVIMYRPIEEVAESYDSRSKNPEDGWLGGKNGFEIGVRDWNRAMRRTREFVENTATSPVLIVSYHDFFYRNEDYIPLISLFLEVEFDDSVREAWGRTSGRFEDRRRQKEPLSEEQAQFIQENKDHEAEAWVLDRLEKQWADPTLPFREADADTAFGERRDRKEPNSESSDDSRLKQQIEKLERKLANERRKKRRLEARVQSLEGQLSKVKGSRAFRLLQSFGRLRGRSFRGK